MKTYLIPQFIGGVCAGVNLQTDEPCTQHALVHVGQYAILIDDHLTGAEAKDAYDACVQLIKTWNQGTAAYTGTSFDLYDDTPTQPDRPPVHERKCRKCKNQSLRYVVPPGEHWPVALCRLCGTQEQL